MTAPKLGDLFVQYQEANVTVLKRYEDVRHLNRELAAALQELHKAEKQLQSTVDRIGPLLHANVSGVAGNLKAGAGEIKATIEDAEATLARLRGAPEAAESEQNGAPTAAAESAAE